MFFSFFRVFVFLLYGQLSGCDLVSHHDLACILLTLMVLDISSHAVWPSVYLLWSKVCSDVFLLLYRWVLPFCCQICNIHFGPPHCFLSSCLFSQGKYTFLRAHLLISISLSPFFSLSLPLSAYWHPPQGHVKIDLKKRHTTPALAISLRSGFQPTFSVIHILLECHLTNRILEAVSIPSLYSLTFWTFSFHWPWLGKPPILV